MKKLINYPTSFQNISIAFLLIIILEIILRFTWHTTTLSLLFPFLIICLHLKLDRRSIRITSLWFYLFPFLIASLFYIILNIQTSRLSHSISPQHFITIVDILTTYIFILPIILSIQKQFYYGLDDKRYHFLIIISLLLIFNATLIATIAIINWYNYIKALPLIPTDIISTFISIILFFIIFIIVHHLYYTRDMEESIPYDIEDMNQIKEIINKCFSELQLYLNNELTIQKLQLQSDIPMQDLRFFFNEYLGMNFYDFVGKYRINHAIDLIHNEASKHTIESISQQCGYKSKTSFIKYFKQETGCMPSEYIKSIAQTS